VIRLFGARIVIPDPKIFRMYITIFIQILYTTKIIIFYLIVQDIFEKLPIHLSQRGNYHEANEALASVEFWIFCFK
jgi:hypothetical protein